MRKENSPTSGIFIFNPIVIILTPKAKSIRRLWQVFYLASEVKYLLIIIKSTSPKEWNSEYFPFSDKYLIFRYCTLLFLTLQCQHLESALSAAWGCTLSSLRVHPQEKDSAMFSKHYFRGLFWHMIISKNITKMNQWILLYISNSRLGFNRCLTTKFISEEILIFNFSVRV